MSFAEQAAIVWVERGIALAILLQTIELWFLRAYLADSGIWRWSILQPEHDALPALLRWPLAAVLPYRAFIVLLGARFGCAACLLASSFHAAPGGTWLAPALLFTQLAICVRFRGAFNGGSDYMTVVILLALSLAQNPLLARAALLYIAVQTTLSYSIAGFSKLRSAAWRNGTALCAFLDLAAERHGAPRALVARLAAPRRSQLLSIAIIAFECTFPVAWLDPRVCAVYLALGLGFHLANSIVFGLNRFLFAWAAAYPALLFCSQLLGSSA